MSERQLSYAIADVTHLLTIYKYLKMRIDAQAAPAGSKRRCGKLEDPSAYDLSPEFAWERLKLRDTRPRALAVAVEVAAWREREAQNRDQPRGRILKDELIAEIVHERPVTKEALEKPARRSARVGELRLGERPSRRGEALGSSARRTIFPAFRRSGASRWRLPASIS